MKIPKNFFGFWVMAAAIIVTASFLLYFKSTFQSQVILDGIENNFSAQFNLNGKDKESFSKVLESLQIPKTVETGFSFRLDATSSAGLAYISPIAIKPKFEGKEISFSGETSHSYFSKETELEEINIPDSFMLAVFAPRMLDFVTARVKYPVEFENWLKENFENANGQYLTIIGDDAQFVLFAKNPGSDPSTLKNLDFEGKSDDFYKEDPIGETTLYLVDASQNDGRPQPSVLFKLNDWLVFSSSREAASAALNALKSKDYVQFPYFNFENGANFALAFRNSDGSNENFRTFLSKGKGSFVSGNKAFDKFLNNVKEASFSLKDDNFSGLIVLK